MWWDFETLGNGLTPFPGFSDFGTDCPEVKATEHRGADDKTLGHFVPKLAGSGEASPASIFAAPRGAKSASVNTLALLAKPCNPRNSAKTEAMFFTLPPFLMQIFLYHSVILAPITHCVQNWNERFSTLCQTVLNFWRDLGIFLTMYQSVHL